MLLLQNVTTRMCGHASARFSRSTWWDPRSSLARRCHNPWRGGIRVCQENPRSRLLGQLGEMVTERHPSIATAMIEGITQKSQGYMGSVLGWNCQRGSVSPTEQAQVRSQSGPLASVPLTALPVYRVSRMDSEPFRVVLLRRLRLPLPLSVHRCSCGRLLDSNGHHRAACSTIGVLSGERGRAGVPRGWSTGFHEHLLARFGLGPEARINGRKKTGSCCRRLISLRRQPVGFGRHSGVGFACERDPPTERGPNKEKTHPEPRAGTVACGWW